MVHQSASAAAGASFRHDPRMRRAFSALGQGQVGARGPAGTSLYWLLRSRRPKLAGLTGRLSPPDLLVTACAVADSGGKLVVERDDDHGTRQDLARAGLDWVVRSGECLPCIRSVRPFDALIIGSGYGRIADWRTRLCDDALLLGLGRRANLSRLAERLLEAELANETTRLRDGRRDLLLAAFERV